MNQKMLFIFVSIVSSAVFFSGCGGTPRTPDVDEKTLVRVGENVPVPDVPVPTGGIVLSVESTAITADEIIAPIKPQLDALAAQTDYDAFSQQAKTPLGNILIQKITDIKLYQKARAALPENVGDEVVDKIVDQEVQKFIASYGGNYATVEQMLKQMGTNWQDFHKMEKRKILIQAFISDEVKVEKPVTHSELTEYYDSIKDENYQIDSTVEFRLIDLETDKFADVNDPNADSEQKASALASEIVERVKKGESFAELAKQYSNDGTAKNGGLWKPVRPGSLIKPYDIVETTAGNMSIGQVSEPIITDGHVFIVQLENKQPRGYEPFEKVQNEVEGRFILARRQEMVNEMINKITSQIDLSYADHFLEFCMQKAYNDARGQIQQ